MTLILRVFEKIEHVQHLKLGTIISLLFTLLSKALSDHDNNWWVGLSAAYTPSIIAWAFSLWSNETHNGLDAIFESDVECKRCP